MRLPFWLLRLLPMWEYICPKCRKTVKKSSHECPHCGERFPLALRVPPTFLKDSKKLEAYVHKHVFPRVSAFERAYLTQFFTEIFSDSFETNDFSAWTRTSTNGSGTNTVISSWAHHGTFAYRCYTPNLDTDTASIEKDFAAVSTEHFRFYIKIIDTTGLGDGEFVSFVRVRMSGGADCAYLGIQDANRALRLTRGYGDGGVVTSATTLSLNTVYCIELGLVFSSTVAEYHVYLDGVEVDDLAQTNKNQQYEGDMFRLGQAGGRSGGFGMDTYFDCVVGADEGPIGPEEEGPTLVEVADSLELAETILRNKTLILSDSLGLADSLYGNKSLLLSDSASLSELVTVIIGEVMKYVTDSVSSADLVSTPSRVLRALEAIGATDNVAVNKVLQITETFSLAEIVEVGVGGVKKTRLFLILGDLAVQLTGN